MQDEVNAMDLNIGSINYLAVAVAIVINMAAGAAWYSPLLFAKPWMAANGLTEESIKEAGSATRGYVVAVIASIVIAFAVALFAQASGAGYTSGGPDLGTCRRAGIRSDHIRGQLHLRVQAAQAVSDQRGLSSSVIGADWTANWRLAVS